MRSATNSPRAATRFKIRFLFSTGVAEISIGAAFNAWSSSAPSARFSSARRVCQLPSAMPAAHAAAASASGHPRGRKEYRASMRYVVIAMFLLIVASLFSALVFIYTDRSGSKRALKALALRVGLSVGLFLFLMAGYYLGWIKGKL